MFSEKKLGPLYYAQINDRCVVYNWFTHFAAQLFLAALAYISFNDCNINIYQKEKFTGCIK